MLNSSIGPSWVRISPIEILVTRACDPSFHEPNYALHLEVAEYINNKKANNPREAAMLIARLTNHRNPHVAILALALLETLVQSCGYPFHLQIATKEFLNELVRRFPERPPPFPGPVMSRILDLIHSWKETICVESRWREDLGNIRDMHRLLSFKGYRFRELLRQSSASATANLKSAEELESEDREAQSAKLQELIRRGTPRDLAAAQELMKVLAGANPDAKPDYRSQALTELNKLEQKVILLNEMLDNFDVQRGERFASGDAYDQVATILTSARPKIQKWISDAESDDPESLDTFLQINDQINTVLNRYEAFKRGDYATSSNPIPAEIAATSKTANDLSLIDFDESSASSNTVPSSFGADDLAGLFGPSTTSTASNPAMPLPGLMGLGQTMTTHAPSPVPPNMFGGMSAQRPFTISPQSTTTPPAITLPITPKPDQTTSLAPNYFSNGASSAASPLGMGTMTPQALHTQQQQQTKSTTVSTGLGQDQTQAKDPFADLAGLF